MRFITKLLLGTKSPLSEQDLIALMTPTGLINLGDGGFNDAEANQSGKIIVERTLAAMRSVNLVTKSNKGLPVELSSLVRSRFSNAKDVDAGSFATFLSETVLTDISSFDSTDRGADDLARGIAFLLEIPNPLIPLVGFESTKKDSKTLESEMVRQFGKNNDDWPVRNKERYGPLSRWVCYLGFGYFDSQSALVVDSTAVLKSVISRMTSSEQSLGEFLVQLSELMPCIGFGPMSSAIREEMGNPLGELVISPGLALGLLRLDACEVIKLTRKSDSDRAYFFQVSDEIPAREFTHVSQLDAR
jgi:hypothetical protein